MLFLKERFFLSLPPSLPHIFVPTPHTHDSIDLENERKMKRETKGTWTTGNFEKVGVLQPTLPRVGISGKENLDRDGIQIAQKTSAPIVQVLGFQNSPLSTMAQESQVN